MNIKYLLIPPFICSYFIEVNLSFKQSSYMTMENDKEVEICIISSCPCPARMTVRMSIYPGTADVVSDYPEQSLSVAFEVSEEESCTKIVVSDDAIPEEQESFGVAIQVNEDYGIGSPGNTTIVVKDTDSKKKILILSDSVTWISL